MPIVFARAVPCEKWLIFYMWHGVFVPKTGFLVFLALLLVCHSFECPDGECAVGGVAHPVRLGNLWSKPVAGLLGAFFGRYRGERCWASAFHGFWFHALRRCLYSLFEQKMPSPACLRPIGKSVYICLINEAWAIVSL